MNRKLETINLSHLSYKALLAWRTSSVAVWRQLGFWYDVKSRFHYVPSACFGFVILTDALEPMGGVVIAAYKIRRPASLLLEWDGPQVVDQTILPYASLDWWINKQKVDWVCLEA